MNKHLFAAWALMVALSVSPASLMSQTSPQKAPATLKVGDMAPDFSLRDQNGHEVKLSSYRGKENVALAFYIFAFTGG